MTALRLCLSFVAVIALVAAVGPRPLAAAQEEPAPTILTDTVSQYGITWRFDKKVPVGQFVNGDYYVVGPITVIGIDPPPADGLNGSVLNLPLNGRAGFDKRDSISDTVPRANRFDPHQFRAPPIALRPGDCLLSSISVAEVGQARAMLSGRMSASPVKTVAALTCLKEAVPKDAFRPSYGDRGQKVYLARNLRRDLLPRLKLPDTGRGRPKENVLFRVKMARWDQSVIANFERVFQRPWIDTVLDQLLNPVENMPNYGAPLARAAGIATLLLCCDYTPEEKEKLLINVTQVGVDLWGLVRAGHRGWPALGGHGSGRKWIIVFSGIMLGDEDMQRPAAKYPNVRFGEDMQTMYGKGWTGATALYAGHTGKDGHPRHAGWGAYEHLPPDKWPSRIGESYRRCCTSIAWVGEALAIRILHAENTWDHPAFLDYVDRWMTEDDTEHLQTIKAAGMGDYDNDWAIQRQTWDDFVVKMWTMYRNNLPPAPAGKTDGKERP